MFIAEIIRKRRGCATVVGWHCGGGGLQSTALPDAIPEARVAHPVAAAEVAHQALPQRQETAAPPEEGGRCAAAGPLLPGSKLAAGCLHAVGVPTPPGSQSNHRLSHIQKNWQIRRWLLGTGRQNGAHGRVTPRICTKKKFHQLLGQWQSNRLHLSLGTPSGQKVGVWVRPQTNHLPPPSRSSE